jgi:hypothetical protein
VKIAVLGDSHVGSLKRGTALLGGAAQEHELVFFGARSAALDDLAIDGRILRPRNQTLAQSLAFTSGGLEVIDTGSYDGFLLYGMGARPFFVRDKVFYSQAVMARALKDVTERRLSYRTLLKLRNLTKKPIYIGHNPMRAAAVQNVSQDLTPYMRGIDLLNAAVYDILGARIFPQPAQTIVNGNGTAMEFTQGSKRLAIGDELDDALHPTTDLNHMNDEFGSLWLADLFATFDEASEIGSSTTPSRQRSA